MVEEIEESPAECASREALEAMFTCFENGQSFRLEAGAGAGKTYSLVKALNHLIDRDRHTLPRRHQQIACITFTNVAREEILSRTDRSPLIYCDTTHAFCWSLISGFQRQIRPLVETMPEWADRIAEVEGIGERVIEYSHGHRSIRDVRLSLHHDDVIPLTISLMDNVKFRRLLTDRFPVILIDEYQDTHAGWVEAIKTHFLGQENAPLFGFFGDHWQKIYGDGCGLIEHPALVTIGKEANFRSVSTVVDALNRMRPELPQFVDDPDALGSARVFHTNGWPGARRAGNHWGGDLQEADAHEALRRTRQTLEGDGWNFSPAVTKILMLTHRGLAGEQGYSNLPSVFRYNDAFAKLDDPHLAFFVNTLEPASEAYQARHYGAMFETFGSTLPSVRNVTDKHAWTTAMDTLLALRDTASVGEVIAHLRAVRRPRLPDSLEDREHALETFDRDGEEEMPRMLDELEKLHAVPYTEIIALRRYHEGHSPFETKHGVKGAEFENVLVVVGRGWNLYNFREMLELAGNGVPAARQAAFERNRNLFYVACSRPKKRLSVLFTQELSPAAVATLSAWFGAANIETLLPA